MIICFECKKVLPDRDTLRYLCILQNLNVFYFEQFYLFILKRIFILLFFFKGIPLFLLFIYLFIFGCVGSSFPCEGFL